MVRDSSTRADGNSAIPDSRIDDTGLLSDGHIIRVPLRHPVREQFMWISDVDWEDTQRRRADLRTVAAETAMRQLYDEYRFDWWDEDDRDRTLIIDGDEQDVELVTPPMQSSLPLTLAKETAESEDVLPDIYAYASALSAREVCVRGWVWTGDLVSPENLETYDRVHDRYEMRPQDLHRMPAPDRLGDFGFLDWH